MNLKKIFFLSIVILQNTFCAQKVKKPYLEPISLYYTTQNLNSISSGKQHAPMIVLFDQLNEETETTANGALAFFLAYNLKRPFFPMLITGSILKNLLIRTRTYPSEHFHTKDPISAKLKEIMDSAQLTSSALSLYDVPESQFILIVPKLFETIFTSAGKNLGIKKLPSLDNLLPKDETAGTSRNQDYKPLIKWLNTHKSEVERESKSSQELEKLLSYDISKDLEKIFINKLDDSTPIWDIFFDGHGTNNPPIIAGLNPNAFNKMLSFFDHKIKTGIMYVLSCSAGGDVKTLLETTKDGVQTNHNFILILGSISNSSVISVAERLPALATLFFINTGFIQDKGTSINNLIRYITEFNSSPFSYHGATRFPQIWFPGGYGFQSPQIIDNALTLGNVFLKTHKENNQPIEIINKLIVLLYPFSIDVPLIITPFNMGAAIPKHWQNLSFVFEKSFFAEDKVSEHLKKQVISKLKAEQTVPNYVDLQSENSDLNPNYYLYPQFISMASGKAQYLFSDVYIKTTTDLKNQQIAGGVLQFIRDAFFDPSKKSQHEYFIDTLTGTNDISITLAASRLLAQQLNKHPLELLLKNRENREITLKNVFISYDPTVISFMIDNSAWTINQTYFTQDETQKMRWNFQAIDAKEHQKFYNLAKEKINKPDITPQKSISAILKEKQHQIFLKKAIELKKRQEIEKAQQTSAQTTMVTPQPVIKPSGPVKLTPKIKPAPAKAPIKLQPKTVPAKPATTVKSVPVSLKPRTRPAPARPKGK